MPCFSMISSLIDNDKKYFNNDIEKNDTFNIWMSFSRVQLSEYYLSVYGDK